MQFNAEKLMIIKIDKVSNPKQYVDIEYFRFDYR